jgi:hypothetical protein
MSGDGFFQKNLLMALEEINKPEKTEETTAEEF